MPAASTGRRSRRRSGHGHPPARAWLPLRPQLPGSPQRERLHRGGVPWQE
jgi:hypothetical protein